MKTHFQRAIMFIAAVVVLGSGSRLMAIQPYHPILLDTGGLQGGKAFARSTDSGGTFEVVCGVLDDGMHNHPAIWFGRGGTWNLLRLTEPAGGGSANAVTILGAGNQRRVVIAGYMDDPTRDGTRPVLWLVNPRNGNQIVRSLDQFGGEARRLIGSEGMFGIADGVIVAGVRDLGTAEMAMLWQVNLATGQVDEMVLPDEGAGAEADVISRNPNGGLSVVGCLVDPATGNEVGCGWEVGSSLATLSRMPKDDGENHVYGMSPAANYAVGVQFPQGHPRWPTAWTRNSSGEWIVNELNNLGNWPTAISASLNGVNSRGHAGGYGGGYADGFTRGFLVDISASLMQQRVFMVNDLIPPIERDGTMITHVGAVGDDNVICGWAEMPNQPGIPRPYVGVPDRRLNFADTIYGPAGDYGGMSREVASFWLDEGLIPGSAMAGSNTASLRGTVRLDIASDAQKQQMDLIVKVVSHLEGNPHERVEQALYFYNYLTQSYDLIGMDSLRGGKMNQSNRYAFSGDLSPYLSTSDRVWFELRWIDSNGQFTNTGFTCQLNVLNVIAR
jgi:hypothetical protein